MRRLLLILTGPDALCLAALVAIGTGCWWERPSAGLIVPGVIVFSCLAFTRVRAGGRNDAA